MVSWNEEKVTRTRLSFELPLDAKDWGKMHAIILSHPEYEKVSQYDDAFEVTADDEYIYISFPESAK